jgi:hypothetical protein
MPEKNLTAKEREPKFGVDDLVPTAVAAKPVPKFGTLKGKVKTDPRAFDPMTDDEVDASRHQQRKI